MLVCCYLDTVCRLSAQLDGSPTGDRARLPTGTRVPNADRPVASQPAGRTA